MLTELVSVAVNAAFLPFKTALKADPKNKIIDEGLDSITTTFAESILFSDDVAKMHIKSELNKRIGRLDHLKIKSPKILAQLLCNTHKMV
jgi:hypothetical protein